MRMLIGILLLALGLPLHGAVAVVHAGIGDEAITSERVRDMLLGRVTTWQSGSPVVIVLCSEPAADLAVSELCGRPSALLQRGWKRLVFSGSGSMPLQADSTQGALTLVARHAGAIVILEQSAPAEGCRVVPLGIATAVPLKP